MALAILRLKKLQERIGLKRSAIYDRLYPKSPRYDPTFPKPVKLGNRDRAAMGFVESEIEEWLARQIEKSRQAAASSGANRPAQPAPLEAERRNYGLEGRRSAPLDFEEQSRRDAKA